MRQLPSHIIDEMIQSLIEQHEADIRQRAELAKWIEQIDERAENIRRQLNEIGVGS